MPSVIGRNDRHSRQSPNLQRLYGVNTRIAGRASRQPRHNCPYGCGGIRLTVLAADRTAKTVAQRTERQQVRDAERAPPARQRDERVRRHSVRPPGWQRSLDPVLVEQEHAVLAPRRTNRDQHELPTHPRMERMRYTNSLLNSGIKRS